MLGPLLLLENKPSKTIISNPIQISKKRTFRISFEIWKRFSFFFPSKSLAFFTLRSSPQPACPLLLPSWSRMCSRPSYTAHQPASTNRPALPEDFVGVEMPSWNMVLPSWIRDDQPSRISPHDIEVSLTILKSGKYSFHEGHLHENYSVFARIF